MGQYHEAGVAGGEGLSYYTARWYDPQTGRFVSADTIVPRAGDPQALNRYSYTRNDPLGRIDPGGRADGCNPALYNCGGHGTTDRRQHRPHNYDAGRRRRPAYNRLNAVQYAMKYGGDGHNPAYFRFENDCTSFVSQVLVAGGLETDEKWYYNAADPYQSAPAWYWTDSLKAYLLERKYKSEQVNWSSSGTQAMPERYQAPPEGVFPATIQGGDIVFYYQPGANPYSDFPHAAVIVGWGPDDIGRLDLFRQQHGGNLLLRHTDGANLVPYIVDHTRAAGLPVLRPINYTFGDIVSFAIILIGP